MITAPVFSELRSQVEDEYRARTPRSRALHAEAQRYLPSGDTRYGTLFSPYPTYVEAGHGCYLVDVDGNELLDFTFNSTSLIHGYAHPAIVEAIKRQAERGTAWNAPNPQLVQLAKLLCTRIPSVETVRFCNSGTEANMQALKAARAFTGRDLILKMQGAYHGTYEGVELNMAAPPLDPHAAPATAGVPRNAADNVVMATFNERDQTAELIRAHGQELAAVVVTPILTRPALGLPSAGYL